MAFATVLPHFQEKNDLTLVCGDGHELKTNAALLCLCSPVISGMFESISDKNARINVPEKSSNWREVLPLLYPQVEPPNFTWDRIEKIIDIAHKYDIKHVLLGCDKFWGSSSNAELSTTRTDSNYVLKWLDISERLQLPALKDKCLTFFTTEYKKALASPQKQSKSIKKPEPAVVFRTAGPSWICPTCSYHPNYAYEDCCNNCGQPRSPSSKPSGPFTLTSEDHRWLLNLNKDTLAQMLTLLS